MRLLSAPIVWLVVFTAVGFAAAYYVHWRGWVKRAYHRDVLAVAALALLAILFFWRPIFDGNVWIPAGGGDMASMLYPNYHFIGESLWAREVPLWNPRLFTGEPFAADIQTGVFYPINLLFWAVAHPVTYGALQWLVYFHFFLAGFTTYVMLCALTTGQQRPLSRLAAMTGAVAYMFSDIFITHIGNLNLIAVAAWLPLVFLFFHRALVERRFTWAVTGGAALAVSFLAGHIQPFLYIVLVVGAYFLYRAYLVARNRATRRELPRLVAIAVVFAVIGFGAMAVQFLPSQELTDLSVRSEITYDVSAQYSLSPAQLVNLFVPDLFGRGPAGYWGQWDRTETGYIGLFTLIAAALALALRRERVVYFLGGFGALALLLALGGNTVLQGWSFEFLPGFDKVRAPARFIMLFDFAVATLAALGVDALLQPLRRRERAILRQVTRGLGLVTLIVVVVLVPAMMFILLMNREQPEYILKHFTGNGEAMGMFALLLLLSLGLLLARQRAWARRSTIGLLAIALIAFDLISAGHDLELNKTDPTAGYNQSAVVQFLWKDQSIYRFDSDTNVYDIWQPNAAPLYGIQEAQGARHPMELQSFRTYWSSMGSRSTAMYDLLNVKYIVGKKGVPLDFSKWKLAFDDDPRYSVYQNMNVLPRAFVVYNSVVQPNLDDHITALRQPDFNPGATVILEKGQALSLPSAPSGTSAASIAYYRNNRLAIDVDAAADGYLVLSDMYNSGWRATVDGRDTSILRADYTFRAVPVAAGKHRVEMNFDPTSWEVGRAISGLTWLLIVGWGVFYLARAVRRRWPRAPAPPEAMDPEPRGAV